MFIFAKAEHENVQNIILTLKPFSNSALIDISARHFHSFIWEGPKIEKGTIFRYLGYLFGLNVSTKDKIEWVLNRPYVMYYLLLLDWKKCHLHVFEGLLKNFLWNKRHNKALPKLQGGLGILHLHTHLQARRVAFIMRISVFQRPLWIEVFWKLIENAQLRYKGSWNLDPWNKFFSHAPLHTPFLTLNFLMTSFKKSAVGLTWNGRQRYVGNSFASLSPYWSFLSNPPLAFSLGSSARYFNNKDISDPWRDWLFARHTKWWDGNASTFYSSLLPSQTIVGQCNARWSLKKLPCWWHTRFHMRVFMCRIFTGHFTLGAFLSKHGMQGVRCPHCASYTESMRHAFWTCTKIQRWWTNLFLFPIWDVKPTKFNSTFLLFASGDGVLDSIRMTCVYLLFWDIWMLRNGMVFHNKNPTPSFTWNFCKAKIRLHIDVDAV
ncbi:hypothetical protein KP509_33G013000 [Ceratopteris richardii]|uniref:Reverse transcriptase zinc-binding domain-containing protein n=1 Tax=Ceratopteris richardii TaxID=49495 RepID=A0A8T2QNN3_CERRI|nr:hypothetical protein KP509_33G013000 [Ceratopteris richardii]